MQWKWNNSGMLNSNLLHDILYFCFFPNGCLAARLAKFIFPWQPAWQPGWFRKIICGMTYPSPSSFSSPISIIIHVIVKVSIQPVPALSSPLLLINKVVILAVSLLYFHHLNHHNVHQQPQNDSWNTLKTFTIPFPETCPEIFSILLPGTYSYFCDNTFGTFLKVFLQTCFIHFWTESPSNILRKADVGEQTDSNIISGFGNEKILLIITWS